MTVAEVVKKMVEYSKGDLHDISHFMKVYAYAKTIAEGENLSPEQQKLVEVTAVVHTDFIFFHLESGITKPFSYQCTVTFHTVRKSFP